MAAARPALTACLSLPLIQKTFDHCCAQCLLTHSHHVHHCVSIRRAMCPLSPAQRIRVSWTCKAAGRALQHPHRFADKSQVFKASLSGDAIYWRATFELVEISQVIPPAESRANPTSWGLPDYFLHSWMLLTHRQRILRILLFYVFTPSVEGHSDLLEIVPKLCIYSGVVRIATLIFFLRPGTLIVCRNTNIQWSACCREATELH